MKTKFLLVVLACLMLLSSCAKGDTPPVNTGGGQDYTTPDVTEDETAAAPVIPEDLKGSGETIQIYTQGWWGYAPLDVIDVGITEATEDLISSGAYNRDRRMEEELGVLIDVVSVPECYDSFDNLLTQALAGLEYELLLLRSAVYTKAVANGMLLNLENSSLMYLDTDKPWWDANSYEALSVCKQYYGLCGDFSVSDDLTLWALFFNKDRREALTGLDNPYDLVENGSWTYEALWEMASQAAEDSDGVDGMTYDDTWGITYLRDTVAGMINSVGIQFGEKDEDGIPYLSYYNETNATKVLSLYDMLYHTDVCYNIHARGGDELAIFTEGRSLFTFGGIYYAPQMRVTEVNFGILPYPKNDISQEQYISSVSPLFLTVLCVPSSNTQNLELRSIFMEEYAYLGNQMVVPEFYDRLLIGRIAKDMETAEILDFIFGNVTYDIGNIFNFGDLAFRIIDMTLTDNRNLSSVYDQFKTAAQSAIDDLVVKLQ